MNLFQKELHVALHGQTLRFRAIKYAILIPLCGIVYKFFGGIFLLKTLGFLLIVAVGVHFLYRYKTDGWTKDWGGYTSLFKEYE